MTPNPQRSLFFDPPLTASDLPRLSQQLAAVAEIMRGGEWYTLQQLRAILEYRGISAAESGISARIRDLRKEPLGWTVERTRVGDGVFAYRVR